MSNPNIDSNSSVNPANSPSNYPVKAKAIYDHTIAAIKLEHGQMHELEKKHLEKRAKSFELLRLLEDCTRYHNAECSRELKEGAILYGELIIEFDRRQDDIHYSYSLRRYCEKYLAEYPQRKNNNAVTFPWASYDESMEQNCIGLLSSHHINEARSYLIGYLESICRDPSDCLSNQGKITMESAGWAVNRHPYGAFMAVFRIALSMLIKDVYRETLTLKSLKGIIDCFVMISQQTWSLHWEKCNKVSNDYPELVVDAIQHALFLQCQYLPRLLYGNLSGNHMYHEFDLIELRHPLKLEDLHRLCSVPEAYCIYPAFSESSHQYQHIVGSASSISAEEACWISMSENPFLVASRDIDIIRSAKTPSEVADVAVALLRCINSASKRVKAFHDHHTISISSTTPASTVESELSADELLPLLTFAFALYFRTPTRDKASPVSLRYQNPSNYIASFKFAEAYLPSHLAMREEGYAVTICLSVLNTLPV